jgi:hypothetical protein
VTFVEGADTVIANTAYGTITIIPAHSTNQDDGDGSLILVVVADVIGALIILSFTTFILYRVSYSSKFDRGMLCSQ